MNNPSPKSETLNEAVNRMVTMNLGSSYGKMVQLVHGNGQIVFGNLVNCNKL